MNRDRETFHLTDRHLATIIAALQSERDRLIADHGLTGKDCQEALDALYRGITPATDGLTYRLGQHSRLISVEHDVRFDIS